MRAVRMAVVGLVGLSTAMLMPSTAGAANPWVRVPAPNPSAQRNVLFGVSCTSPTVCTAVGYYYGTTGLRVLVERTTDGTTWTRTTVPAPSPVAELLDVSCTSATTCTAVGAMATGLDANNQVVISTLVMRTTNGTSWARVNAPSPAGVSSGLASVSCVTATRCRAVGFAGRKTLALRTSTGTSWFREASPNLGNGSNELDAIDCADNGHCMAVGGYYAAANDSGHSKTLTMKLAGGPPWTVVPSPNPAPTTSDAALNGVRCPTPSTCVAVGLVLPAPNGVHRGFVLRTTDLNSWTRSATPVAVHNVSLNSVDCVSATECTAVGDEENDASDHVFNDVILRTTDGVTWSSPSPESERAGRGLIGVSCPAATACVGVGTYNASGNVDDPLKALVMKET